MQGLHCSGFRSRASGGSGGGEGLLASQPAKRPKCNAALLHAAACHPGNNCCVPLVLHYSTPPQPLTSMNYCFVDTPPLPLLFLSPLTAVLHATNPLLLRLSPACSVAEA